MLAFFWLRACCVSATARYLTQHPVSNITLVTTGNHPGAEEDDACAEYLTALMEGDLMDLPAMVRRVRAGLLPFVVGWAPSTRDEAQQAEFLADLDYCLGVDRFNFAMVVQRRVGLLIMESAT